MLKYSLYLIRWCHYRLNGHEPTPYSPFQTNLHEEEGFYSYTNYKKTLTFRRKWALLALMDDNHTVSHMSDHSDKRFKIRFNQ